jgi:hypothetical protein
MLTMSNLTKRHCLWNAKKEDEAADKRRERMRGGHDSHSLFLGQHTGRANLWRELAETDGMPEDTFTAAQRVETMDELPDEMFGAPLLRAKDCLGIGLPVVLGKRIEGIGSPGEWEFCGALSAGVGAQAYAAEVAGRNKKHRVVVVMPRKV